MATTLSYGFVKPVTGDKGSVWFPAIENNITQLNDHSHNGTNSALLASTSVQATTQAISSASWSAQGGGRYRQTITMPAGITFDTHAVELYETAGGAVLAGNIEKVSSNTYYVYVNDNTLNLKALYT